jgi:AraC-like DNA-binding protein
MTTRLFDRYQVFHTSDPDEAHARISATLWPHRLVPGKTNELNAYHNMVHFGYFSLHYLEYGRETYLSTTGSPENCFVLAPLHGEAQILCGRQQATVGVGWAAVASADEPLSMQWSADCRILIMKLDATSLLHRLAGLIRASTNVPLRFHLAMDLRAGTQSDWWHYVEWLVGRVDADDGLVTARGMATPIWNHLGTALLLAQPNNYTTRINQHDPEVSLHYVRAAVDLIEAHPERQLTVRDIAAAAGVSVRTLQQGFRDQLFGTPINHLYGVRLQRVHDDLRETDPDSSLTVDEITAYWQVAQTSKFYRDYRQRFGETPAATKRSARPRPAEH